MLIDVSLVEITKNDNFEYDLSIIANAKDFVTDNIAIKEGINAAAAGMGSMLEGGFKSGSTANAIQGFYSDDKIQAILTAIDSKSYGRILAKPKVLVNDNEKGKINTTQTIYVSETTTTYPSQGTTGGAALNPVYTTVFKPYPAKIELTITPHISEGNLLRLEVSMVREDFETTAGAEARPPNTTASNVETVVTVPDGFTIILGGLTKLNQAKGTNKVPLLGDIPIVGALFRGVSNTAVDRQLYVFVKANILRPGTTEAGLEQLQTISAKNRTAFEESERRFQELRAIPSIKPEPVEPVHVLDRD